jgi:signal transduction histidine kinase
MEWPENRRFESFHPPAMRYDDRLATVLRLTPVGPTVTRIQFRQLLDLLGTLPAHDQGELVDEAYLRLAQLAAKLPAADRLAMLRHAGLRLRAPRLVAALAQSDPVVAQAAINAAQLSDEQWLDLIPALPLAHRGLLRGRGDLGAEPRALLARLGIGDHALPDADLPDAGLSDTGLPNEAGFAPPPSAAQLITAPLRSNEEDIGTILRRIEAFRQARSQAEADAPHLPLGLGEDAARSRIEAFDFTSDGEGRIIWSESHVAPMVVGHHLGSSGAMASALQLHQPLRGLPVRLAGAAAISGAWQVDAVPRFDPVGGRYLGYLGRFRRPAADAHTIPAPVATPDSEAERLRQLLHELRTPVNAIQGFAEIIQQQLFGPAPHEYRALAASIAGDAARMLAGFEELDRYAKLDSGAMVLDSGDAASGGCDLAACLAATVENLQPAPSHAGAQFHYEGPPEALPVALAPLETERLCWRLLATLSGNAAPEEILPVALAQGRGLALVRLALPKALAMLDDAALFHAAAQPVGAGMFGTGFALRLAEAEARAAGGSLHRDGGLLMLGLPVLTASAAPPSEAKAALSPESATAR